MSDASALPPAPPRYVHGLFCEQVRDEVGGTQTYVGVFGQQIILPFPPPALVGALAAVIWVVSPRDEAIGSLATRLHVPGGQVMDAAHAVQPASSITPGARQWIVGLVVRVGNLLIPEAGRLWLEVIVDGTSWLGATLRVTAPVPTEATTGPPPAS